MTTETLPAVRADAPSMTPFEVMERVITSGDLAAMKPQERVAFYWRTCESLGLNPLTRPFEFISLNGKLTMYARKDATDQLRKLNSVSVSKLERERTDDMMLVTAYGRDRSGREDSALGVVSIKGLSGEALANAVMKAETKAKRRLTLSLVGLGFLDETEVDGADPVEVDPATGEVTAKAAPKSLLEAVRSQQAKLADEPAPAVEGTATDVADAESRPEPRAEAPAVASTPPEAERPTPPARRAQAKTSLCLLASPYGDGQACGLEKDHPEKLHKSIDQDGALIASWE